MHFNIFIYLLYFFDLAEGSIITLYKKIYNFMTVFFMVHSLKG